MLKYQQLLAFDSFVKIYDFERKPGTACNEIGDLIDFQNLQEFNQIFKMEGLHWFIDLRS